MHTWVAFRHISSACSCAARARRNKKRSRACMQLGQAMAMLCCSALLQRLFGIVSILSGVGLGLGFGPRLVL